MFFSHPWQRGVLATFSFAIVSTASLSAQGIPPAASFRSQMLAAAPSFVPACMGEAPRGWRMRGSDATFPDELAGTCAGTDSPAPNPVVPARLRCKSDAAGGYACEPERDEVKLHLQTMGKKGAAIQEARQRALEILRSENACSAWYLEKDPDAIATFESLAYQLDARAESDVAETIGAGQTRWYVNPYVARVTQDGGAYQTVTLNAAGAFFRTAANVKLFPAEGGPSRMVGTRNLHVGPYEGGTPQAQLTTVLHEFGHVVGLLGTDNGDIDGKSAHNTALVLQHCGTQITGSSRHPLLSTTR